MIIVLMNISYCATYIPALFLAPMFVKCCDTQSHAHGRLFREYSKIAYLTHMLFVFVYQYDIVKYVKIREPGFGCFFVTVLGTFIIFIGTKIYIKMKE